MDAELFDIVQIGYGPVGQTMAALLGQQGHSVIVFERQTDPYAFARAGHVDHEIMRIFQSIKVAEAFEKVTQSVYEYDWFNGEGKRLFHFSGNTCAILYRSAWKSLSRDQTTISLEGSSPQGICRLLLRNSIHRSFALASRRSYNG